ncbi:hypothetical protein N7467_008544 [Penicillium canescens]|nr:hypothetical protein N7467_008544 [Penicillium canescens]
MSEETAQKINQVLNDFGRSPLHNTPLENSLDASPGIILAMAMDALVKARPISHELTQRTIKALIDAGYHDINTPSNSSWDDRVAVLADGGYNRYREQCATNLGELAELILNKYGQYLSLDAASSGGAVLCQNVSNMASDGDLNNLLYEADFNRDEAGILMKEIKGMGDLAVEVFFNNVQSVWPCIAPFVDSRSLKTAIDVGIGDDLDHIYQTLQKDPVRMSWFANGLSEVRLQKKQDVI